MQRPWTEPELSAAAGIELNLPDLPEVPISLGPAAAGRGASPPPPAPLGERVRETLTTYLPLLLMVLLALGTWWLVKNSPQPIAPRVAEAPRSEPDYTMGNFSVRRFARDGSLKVRVEGRQMRHFPDTGRIEVDDVTIRSFAPDGRVTQATARQAVTNADVSEVQLTGGAKVNTVTPAGEPVEIESEYLQAFIKTEQLRTHLPVRVRYGQSEMRSKGLAFDNLAQRLDLQGPMRGIFPPRPQGAKR
ncbi:MAG TPA: LPS export ABC transporter periplasmic protein LptC [Rubrivivax sp.]